MGPDRDAGVVPTQFNGAVGGSRADAGPVSGARAAVSTDGDPPTLQLPPVPAGTGPRTGESRDTGPRRRERRSRPRPARPNRGLKRAIWATMVVLILGVGALVATDLHTWHLWHRFDTGSTNASSSEQHHSSEAASVTLTPVSSQDYSAAYEVTAPTFSVTVSTDRPTWLEVRAGATGPVTFAAELPANTVKALQANGPLWLQVGAGGSTVMVRAEGKVIGTLRPALAPWQVTFTPTQAGG